MKNNLLKYSGLSIAIGGVLTLLINVGLSPLLPQESPSAIVAASEIFLWRQSLSAVTAILLMLGIVGVYERQLDASGRFGLIAFLMTIIGCAMLLAQEWNQIFIVRDLAIRAPETMIALDAEKGMSLPDVGSLIAFSFFVLGWILFSISMLMAKVYDKKGTILTILGLFSAPVLGAALPQFWGLVIGNAILSAGWIWIGLERFRS